MLRFLLALALLCFAAAEPAQAQNDVASFYKGKQIRIVVGSAAGGGYDINARVVARYLGKYIPGNPTIIVENMPGAASLTMANSLYNSQPRDGTVIGTAINSIPTVALLNPIGVHFNPNDFTWIGSTNSEVYATYVWHTAPVQSYTDLLKQELIVGAETGTAEVDFPLTANALLGTKFKIIRGYKGTTDIHKAMESGEVQGVGGSGYAVLKAINADWLAEKKVKVILQWGFHKDPELLDVPSVLDSASSEADKQALRLVLSRLEYSRPFFAPPSLPPERTAALRNAFNLTMKDPGFLADEAKVHMEVVPTSGEDVAALVGQISGSPASVVARVRAILGNGTGGRE